MPPKNSSKGGNATSKKTENKKKEKVIEDKTFGLKNKKGAKQQRFIQQVQVQVKNSGKNKEQLKIEKEREDQKKEKEKKRQELLELNNLIKPVQNASKGADPSTVLCAFFKQGTCGKGSKCKFSHDLNVERKSAKKSMYCDSRDLKSDKETNENWGTLELNEVINKKHGKEATNQTPIICKYFLDAVETYKYGWFWTCINGDKCKYRHALPEGYVLKRDRKKDDKGKEVIAIEDLVERQRADLCTKELNLLTLQSFLEWKKKKLREQERQRKKEERSNKKDKSGKESGMSGREMFQSNKVSHEDNEQEDDEGVELLTREDEEESKQEWKNAIDYDLEIKKYRDFEKNAAKELGLDGGVEIDEALFDEDLDGLEDELDDLNVS